MHKQVFTFLLFLTMTAMACQILSPNAEPTATSVPPATAEPTAMGMPASAEPTSAPTTRAAPVESIVPQAEEACAATENAPVVGGFITTPILALKKAVYKGGEWEVETLLNNRGGVLAEDAAAVQVVACIKEEQEKSGKYKDGADAIDTFWAIWFVTWPQGEVLGRMSLVGAAPGIKFRSGPGVGEPPVLDFVNVLLEAGKGNLLAVEGAKTARLGDVKTAFAADGRVMAVADAGKQITLWNLEGGNVLNQFDGQADVLPFGELALSPDGSLVAVNGIYNNNETTMVFDDAGTNLYTLSSDAPAFSPDGNVLATGDPTEKNIVTFEIWLTDSRSGSLIAKLPDARVERLAFSADGRWLVSMEPFGEMILWDIPSRTLVSSFDGFDRSAGSVAISPDGRLVAAQSTFGGVRVWVADSWALLYSTDKNGESESRVRFSADGRKLAFAGTESLVDIFASDEPPEPEDFEAHILAWRKITLVNLDDLSTSEIQLPLPVTDFFFAPSGEELYAVLSGGVVLRIHDTAP